MAKKRISSVDLSWMIFERMRDEPGVPRGVAVAVVPDDEQGWIAIVEGRGGKFLDKAAIRKLRSIEAQLRATYSLAQ